MLLTDFDFFYNFTFKFLFSQNILTRSNEVIWDALLMRKMVGTEFQPENLKEGNHLENKREDGKTMFKGHLNPYRTNVENRVSS